MGYRLHFAKHYAPEWKGGYFSSSEVSQFEKMYYDIFSENGWNNESEDMFELDRGDIERYIEGLRSLPAEKTHKYMKDYTNEDFIDILQDILTSEDETIRIEWF